MADYASVGFTLGRYPLALLRDVSLVEKQRRVLLRSQLLCMTGTVQRQDGVLHLIASKLEDYTPLLGRIRHESRDFR